MNRDLGLFWFKIICEKQFAFNDHHQFKWTGNGNPSRAHSTLVLGSVGLRGYQKGSEVAKGSGRGRMGLKGLQIASRPLVGAETLERG